MTSNDLYRWVKAMPDIFPKERGNYFLRHPYENGTYHGWWAYIFPEAIDKDYWIKMGYEWLEKVEADQQEKQLSDAKAEIERLKGLLNKPTVSHFRKRKNL